MFHDRHAFVSFPFRQSEQWRALASAVDGGEGRQAKFLRLLGVKSAGGNKKGESEEGKHGKEQGGGKGTEGGVQTDKQGGGKGKGQGDVEAEERKLEAALEKQFDEGLKHRHHRHGGLGL